MEENHEDGEDLPSKLNRIKKQIERERFLHINEKFKQRYERSVDAHSAHYQLLALTRSSAVNMLSSRINRPLQHFSGFSKFVSNKEYQLFDEDDVTISSVIKLPILQQLPRSITWVFTDRNQLMAKSDSVIDKRQIYYEDGEAVELLRDSEEVIEDDKDKEDEKETEKKKYEFSEDVDRFIWKFGQEHSLDDLVVQSALSKFLKLDVSDILERYNELKKLKNEENVGESSNSRSKSLNTTFVETVERHFCRRCLIFDCRMHENTNQPMMNPKQRRSCDVEDVRKQCSEHCYLKVKSVTEAENCVVTTTSNEWTNVEKDFYLQGVKIFGRNSCLITRNILAGLKTCLEVYNYMSDEDQLIMLLQQNKITDTEDNIQVNKETSRKITKPGLCKKLKPRKYASYPLALKKTAKEEKNVYKQYTPCTCESVCGDRCPCLTNGNCCEKYCGCLKVCKNRFKGCDCAKGQCKNRKCPCFAATRECDPDVCRNCRLSCGDGSLGETSEQGQCNNMQFLLKKHKRIIIGRSDVHGWGAFTQHSLKKNDFLGEYTGELISHGEANERGRAEDRLGYSYLFTLNDQFEIDARRKGSKCKFLNHSSNPNCYAKMMIVRGDHKIGLFANRAIKKGEELFFDYCYGPGQAEWSRSRTPRTKSSSNSGGGASKNSKDKISPSS